MPKFLAIVTLRFSSKPTIFIHMINSFTNSTFFLSGLNISTSFKICPSSSLESLLVHLELLHIHIWTLKNWSVFFLILGANIELEYLKGTCYWLTPNQPFNWTHQFFNTQIVKIFSFFNKRQQYMIILFSKLIRMFFDNSLN